MSKINYEDVLWADIQSKKLTGFIRQHHFNPKNKRLSFDFAHLDLKLAVEVEGGLRMFKKTKTGKVIAVTGKHTSVAGFTRDCVKYNDAMIDGWYILRVTLKQVENKQAIIWVQRMVDKLSL